ncbi:unnamed protein product [Spodoptera littoralis]|uniref:Protein cueball n=1 Tax=Spodoptera littoralis TaxID=7109 RepID=A0A9P0I201_SPOLI|nr:unnamed protein product [Spodoptera littoralis]CAH1638564.1 unnamed protein product [Spodoptera littoralis]
MYNLLFLLVVAPVIVVQSWDIVTTVADQLEFYDNGIKVQSEVMPSRDLTALTYDALHDTLIFVDKQSDNGSIFSYNKSTQKFQCLVAKKTHENIQDVAFDPAKELLFWTDLYERSIYWISLKHRYENYVSGNLLFKMDDELPRSIAVDSCRGYVYWTNINVSKPSIERSRYNSTEREVLIDNNIYMPISLTIDQQTKKLYWADDKEGIKYSIESADLDGKNRVTLLSGFFHQPNALTVSKGFIYWVDWGYKSMWQLSKNPPFDAEPVIIKDFNNETPFGIAANYKIEDQIEGIEECNALKALLPRNSKTRVFDTITKDVRLNDLITTDVESTVSPFDTPELSSHLETTTSVVNLRNINSKHSVQKAFLPRNSKTRGFDTIAEDIRQTDLKTTDYPNVVSPITSFDTPELSSHLKTTTNNIEAYLTVEERKFIFCHNFCLNGDCHINSEGKPECRCDKLYLGNRCETHVCYNYCLNNGVCVYGDNGLSGCSCPSNFEGSRCEIWKNPITLYVNVTSG